MKWGSSPVAFNWNNPSYTQIAHLMRYLGIELNAEYDANGTSASADNARKWFSKNGYTVTKSKDIEAVQARRWLSEGNLIFTIGFPGYYHVGFIFRVPHTDHVWVIDGYLNSFIMRVINCPLDD